jgi:8-oxo-dGTP pyrophosphatase MutT (NUDIX family)
MAHRIAAGAPRRENGEPTNAAEDEHDELRWFALEELPHIDLAHPAYSAFFRGLLTATG